MDQIIMSQKVNKWNEACRYLKGKQSELSVAEWTSIELLADFWREHPFDACESEELIAVLNDSDKYHANNREIILQIKQFRSIAKIMYTKDKETFEQFKVAMKAFTQANHSARPQIERDELSTPFIDNNLMMQHAKKWHNAISYFLQSYTDLSKDEQQVLSKLTSFWYSDWNQNTKNESELYILILSEGDKLHLKNKEIIVHSKDIRTIIKNYATKDAQTFLSFKSIILNYLQDNPLPSQQEQALLTNRTSTLPSQQQITPRNNRENSISTTQPPRPPKKKKSHGTIFTGITIAVLLLLGTYLFWFKDYRINKDIPRNYIYTNILILRSSTMEDVENNRLGTLPYGTELITYSNENGWAYVEVNGKKGYVPSNYLLNADDFQLLNGVWGNENTQELISTAKCRLAVLDFIKSNNMKTGNTAWQIFAKPKEIKPNNVLLLNLNDGYDAFAELAFIITNNETSQRKLALYAFSKDETPIFRYSEDAPTQGDIKSITYNKWNEKYKVNYSNVKQISSTNETVKQDQENLNETSSSESSPNMVSILSVDFANVNFVNKILTDYGQPLYSDMEYLRPKIHYKKKLDKEENFKFQIKIIHPDNRLECNRISPTGYTFEQEVKLAEKEGYLDLKSWGSSNGDFYKAGSYRYEIWCNDQELHSSIVKIQETKITDKSGKLITTASAYKVYDNAEVMPEFPDGGYEGMKKYLREKVQHSRASKNGQKGHVLVECIIEADGSISNVKASKGVYHALNEDAVRIVMGMPKWKPGKIGNKAVRVKYTIPVSF